MLYEVITDAFIVDSMGWVLYRQGDAGGAVTQLRRAWSLRPDAEIGAHLGEVLWVTGQHEEAVKAWRDAQDVDSANPRITSYNVCYTKLLRPTSEPASPFEPPQYLRENTGLAHPGALYSGRRDVRRDQESNERRPIEQRFREENLGGKNRRSP